MVVVVVRVLEGTTPARFDPGGVRCRWMVLAESSPMADEALGGMGGGGDFNSYGGMIRSGVLQSLSMTVLSELGDKTFFIAAVMAMRYSRVKVLVGAMLAMVTMTVLSAGMGAVAETMISKLWTQRLATVLFLSFGVHMLYDALKDELRALPRILKTKAGDAGSAAGGADESRQSVMASELAEVEAELDSKFKKDGKTETKQGRGMQFVVSRLRQLDPVILEAFMMTFVAEWGDRYFITETHLYTYSHKTPAARRTTT